MSYLFITEDKELLSDKKRKKLSEETKSKMSKAHIGIKYSKQTLNNMKNSKSKFKGIPRSKELNETISKLNKGILRSEETKKKISMSNKGVTKNRKPIIVDGIKYKTLKEVSILFNISEAACRYRIKSDGFPDWYR